MSPMVRGSLTDVGTVDEAEQIEQEHRWNDVQVDFPTEFGLSLGVELDKRIAVAVDCSVIVPQFRLNVAPYLSVAAWPLSAAACASSWPFPSDASSWCMKPFSFSATWSMVTNASLLM